MSENRFLRQQAFIDGQWIDADGGETITVTNPATGEVLGTVPNMGASETRRAIEAADRAMKEWASRTAADRAKVLRKWFELMLANQDELARLLTAEQGKSLTEARGEIAYAASFLEWFAEEGKRAYGEVIPTHDKGKRIITLRQPVGVVGAITPWNFPSAMITRKVGPALAAGCAVVLKPAAQTPYSAFALAVLGEEAGLPKGLFNVITGSASAIGGELTSNETVRKISFTGSTEVGRTLMEQSARSIKKMSLELGGNAPFIVFDDADIDAAVQGAVASKYRNAGQTCVCTNRFYVQAGVYDQFVEKMKVEVEKLKVGNGMEEGVQVGPLIDDKAIEKVQKHLDDALGKGAKLLTGGKPHELGGTFFQPTVVADVTQDMLICQEETFGPLAGVVRFETEDEGVALANDTIFGLAGYFYSRDIGRIWRVAEAMETGMIGINTGILSTEVAPFGGVKQSGLGREGSRHGLEDYLEIKYLCLGI
ncbi:MULTISPECIES: NAD-dependent succinate-semialdehyde dehydrogenase [unclassified Brevundimonas]|uniref:NAD-dependent succinate-semialdehyde dehydrogenase n=1 Tax=unclassified Brevundimonas TaxID=2622653 RepID=UPI0025BB4317|nr:MULTISPECIES: NAD-dependent succinate-semialdehyde dehydrogenase [unclassified Brevundimonas]